MTDIAKEMRDLANEPIITGPEGRALLRRGAAEIERLERELRHQKDLVDGYKQLARS